MSELLSSVPKYPLDSEEHGPNTDIATRLHHEDRYSRYRVESTDIATRLHHEDRYPGKEPKSKVGFPN